MKRCLAVLMLLFAGSLAFASQNPLSLPTIGPLSGLNAVQDINNANDSLNTCNSGATAPSNQPSGSPSASNCWDDTSVSGWIKRKVYDGAQWVLAHWIDTTNHYYVPQVGGGAVNNVASAATTDLCSVNPFYLNITGTVTIASFGSNCQVGQSKRVQFSGALTLTYNATSLIIPSAANIATAAGDTADLVYLGSGNWIVTSYVRATGSALTFNGQVIGAASLLSSALAMGQPINLGLTASVSSNQLTVNITGANGSAPSPVNPVLIPFRSATLATGTPTIDSLQSALSITVNSGNTLGTTSGVAARIWIYAIDNGGTVVIGLMTCSNATAIFSCSDDLLYNTAAGTSGGSSNGTLYGSTGSLSGKAVRIIGYLEATEATAGTWATAPSKIQLFGPGVKKPGDVIQTVTASTSTNSNSPTTSFTATALTVSIAPASAADLVHVVAQVAGLNSAASATCVMQNGRSGPTLFGNMATSYSNAQLTNATLDGFDQPNTTSPTAYADYYKSNVAGDCSMNAVTNGITPISTIKAEEIMGALDVPVNVNDDESLRMIG